MNDDVTTAEETREEFDIRFCDLAQLAFAMRRRSADIMQEGNISEGFFWNAIAQRIQEAEDALAMIANANEADYAATVVNPFWHLQKIAAAARGPKPKPDDEREQ